MQQNGTNKTLQAQVVAQWITSLAISVICCAILFIVFAGYIVDLHNQTNLLSVKVDLLQERNTLLQNDLAMIKRGPVVQINSVTPPQAQDQAAAQSTPENITGAAPTAPEAPAPVVEEPKPQGIVVQDVVPGTGLELMAEEEDQKTSPNAAAATKASAKSANK